MIVDNNIDNNKNINFPVLHDDFGGKKWRKKVTKC